MVGLISRTASRVWMHITKAFHLAGEGMNTALPNIPGDGKGACGVLFSAVTEGCADCGLHRGMCLEVMKQQSTRRGILGHGLRYPGKQRLLGDLTRQMPSFRNKTKN